MLKEIYVIDFETTGLDRYPYSIPTEISIYKIAENLDIHHIYDTLISWPAKYKNHIDSCWWSKKSKIKFSDLRPAPDMKTVWSNIKKHLENKSVTSWNTEYDLDKFINSMMKDYPKFDFTELDCPMLTATDILQIPGYYGNKWPALEEAAAFYRVNLDHDGYFHRADFDCHVAALIIKEMIKRGDYE